MRSTGARLLFLVEPTDGGSRGFTLHGVQQQLLRYESDALKALERGGIGVWSSFPHDGVQATVTRDQLIAMGFRGNF